MNDEVGGGYSGYGYLAWGYFDTAEAFYGYLLRYDFIGLFDWGMNTNANYPVVPFLMSVAMLLLKSPTLVVARLPVEVCGALLAAFIYLLGRDLISKFAGLVSGLFVALDPVLITYSRVAVLDVPLELFFVVCLFSLYQGLARHSKLAMAFSGIACALAVLSKITGWLLLPFALFLLVIWRFLNGEGYNLLTRNFAIFILSFAFVLLVAFPWVGYGVLTGKYYAWLSSVSTTFSDGSHFGPTSITVFMLGKLTLVELLTFGLGMITAIWQFFRARNRFPVIVVLSWFFVVFSSLELISVKLNHYMVLLIPSILMLSGYGVFGCRRVVNELISKSGKLVSSHMFINTSAISYLTLLLLVGGAQFLTVFQYYPYFSLHSSPLISDPLQTFEVHGEEAIPAAVDFLRSHVPDGSVIGVAGQVHLFTYYLPEYKIVGLGEFYPYSDEPIAFLYLSGIKYLVVQMGFQQISGKTDPVLLRLPSFQEESVSRVKGYDLIWIYDIGGIYQPLFSNVLDGEWECHQGYLSNGNDRFTLSIAPNYTYAYAVKEIGEVDSMSRLILAWEAFDFNVNSFRIEMWSNQSNIANLFPPKQKGIWTYDISRLVGKIQSSLRLVLVVNGEAPQFLELKSLLFLR